MLLVLHVLVTPLGNYVVLCLVLVYWLVATLPIYVKVIHTCGILEPSKLDFSGILRICSFFALVLLWFTGVQGVPLLV